MSFYKSTITFTCLSLLIFSCATEELNTSSNEKVDALFSEWNNLDGPGYGLGVIKGGKLVYAKGYGAADLEHDVPISPSSVFYIGSVSKQFVTMCLLLLEEAGKINLDAEIQEYLPDFPRYEAPLTIRNFIHHTSGVRDYLTLWTLAGNDYLDHIDKNAVYDMIKRQKVLNFTPGERYLYSNSCYFMLAMVVEKASGQSIKDYAADNIFKPLGMKDSHFHDDYLHLVKNRAFSYSPKGIGYNNLIMRFDLVGSGGVYSNINDMYLWDQNFKNNVLGKGDQGLIDKMHEEGLLNNGESTGYAFAIANGTYRGLKTSGHTGALAGYRANHLRFPEQDFSVILLGNLSSHNTTTMAQKVAELYLEAQMEPAEERKENTNPSNSNEATLYQVTNQEQYVGKYYSEELDVDYTVYMENEKLYFRVKGNPPMQMTGKSNDIFSFQGADAVFTRVNNSVTGFRIYAGRVQNLDFVKQ